MITWGSAGARLVTGRFSNGLNDQRELRRCWFPPSLTRELRTLRHAMKRAEEHVSFVASVPFWCWWVYRLLETLWPAGKMRPIGRRAHCNS